jgi:tetratricopeptide (TPR) repeat protein
MRLTNSISRRLVAGAFLSCAVFAAMAQAETFPGCEGKVEQPRRLPALSQGLLKKIEPVDAMISPLEDPKTGVAPKPNYKEGWARLQKIVDNCKECNPYEQAQLYNRAAFTNYSLDNVQNAIKYYEKVAGVAPNIPLSLEQQTLFTVAQLKASVEDFKGSIATFKKWEKTCPKVIPNDYWYMQSQIYYQTGDKANAIKFIDKAVKQVEAKSEVPKESWYRLQMALYVDKEDYKTATTVAEKIVVHYSTAKNVSQLAGLYGMTGNEKGQLALLDALNVMGELSRDSEYRNLASLYQSSEAPYLAAKVLEKGLKEGKMERNTKNLEYLGAALRQSQEIKKSIPVMEEAASKSGDGKLYAQLSAIHLDAENYKEAIASANKAINKGGLKSAGEPYFYRGNAEMQLKDYGAAIVSLQRAVNDERYGKYARQLLDYVEKEKKREADLAQAELDAKAAQEAAVKAIKGEG